MPGMSRSLAGDCEWWTVYAEHWQLSYLNEHWLTGHLCIVCFSALHVVCSQRHQMKCVLLLCVEALSAACCGLYSLVTEPVMLSCSLTSVICLAASQRGLNSSFAITMLVLSTSSFAHCSASVCCNFCSKHSHPRYSICRKVTDVCVYHVRHIMYPEHTWMCVMLCLLPADFATTP